MTYKDVNDCLMAGLDRAAIHAAVQGARDFAPEKVVAAAELEKDFLKWVFDRAEDQGIELPFDFPQVKFRRKEMILWMGVKGCGKSTLLDFVAVAAMAQGERVLIGSFEEPWEKTNDKLCRQAFGGLYFDKRALKKCEDEESRRNFIEGSREQTIETHRWLGKSLWYYQHVGIVHWRQLLDDMRWARRRLGITFFVVDNFMRLGISKDDYSQQADCAIAFAGLAMELDATIVLVIHQDKDSGKAKNRNKISGNASSASGAHEIGDNAATIIEIQRDDVKGKQMSELWEERKVAEQIGDFSENEFNAKKTALDLKPDGKIILHNQRNGDLQDGSKHLWFLWESQQYVDCPAGHAAHAPIRFVAKQHLMAKTPELPTDDELRNG